MWVIFFHCFISSQLSCCFKTLLPQIRSIIVNFEPALNTTNIPILVETSRNIIEPKYDLPDFQLTLAVQCLIYNWNQEK